MRFAVMDSGNSKCVAQRVVPLSKLRPGYRHLRLRALNNSSLDHSTLFIYSKLEEEEYVHVDDDYVASEREKKNKEKEPADVRKS